MAMKLQIERPYVEALAGAFPNLTPLKEQLRFGDRAEIAFNRLSNAELGFLQALPSRGARDAGPFGADRDPSADL